MCIDLNLVHVLIYPDDFLIVAGDTVLLTCVGYGVPLLSISWSRNSTILANDTLWYNNSRITFKEEVFENGSSTFLRSSLEICITEVADTDKYSCTATNVGGNHTVFFEMTVMPGSK